MKDMKLRSVNTDRLIEICPGLENRLTDRFDDMVWQLMKHAADNMHLGMEPWYSCLDPNLPNFHPIEEDDDADLYEYAGGSYVKTPSKSELREQKMKEEGVLSKVLSMFTSYVDDKKAKGKKRMR